MCNILWKTTKSFGGYKLNHALNHTPNRRCPVPVGTRHLLAEVNWHRHRHAAPDTVTRHPALLVPVDSDQHQDWHPAPSTFGAG